MPKSSTAPEAYVPQPGMLNDWSPQQAAFIKSIHEYFGGQLVVAEGAFRLLEVFYGTIEMHDY